LRASTSSKYSLEPRGFGEWRMLHGRASQYSWTLAIVFSADDCCKPALMITAG